MGTTCQQSRFIQQILAAFKYSSPFRGNSANQITALLKFFLEARVVRRKDVPGQSIVEVQKGILVTQAET